MNNDATIQRSSLDADIVDEDGNDIKRSVSMRKTRPDVFNGSIAGDESILSIQKK